MNKCPNCKKKLLTDHAFCPKCGFDLRPDKVSKVNAVTEISQPEVISYKEAGPQPGTEQPQEAFVEKQTTPARQQRMFSNPFSFEGRIRRMEYVISVVPIVSAIVIINSILESMRPSPSVITFLYIPLYWIFWAQGAKRCHDLGNSGWFQIIPLYGLWMIFADGQPGINKYGRNPKEN